MAREHVVRVGPVPPWVPARQWLGDDRFAPDPEPGWWTGVLDPDGAADVAARLRGLGAGGHAVAVQIRPSLKRPVLRAGRTRDARRRRDTTPGFTRPGCRLDEEGRWSLTPEALALAIGRQIASALPDRATVLDAGCGAGGNAIGFARAGLRVIAVERDPGRVADARHNVGVYGVQASVQVTLGDATEAIATTSAQAVFVDPPWGEYDHRRCGLDDLGPLRAWLDAAAARGLPLWAKVPPSFDPATVPGAVPAAWFGRANGDRHRLKCVTIAVTGR